MMIPLELCLTGPHGALPGTYLTAGIMQAYDTIGCVGVVVSFTRAMTLCRPEEAKSGKASVKAAARKGGGLHSRYNETCLSALPEVLGLRGAVLCRPAMLLGDVPDDDMTHMIEHEHECKIHRRDVSRKSASRTIGSLESSGSADCRKSNPSVPWERLG